MWAIGDIVVLVWMIFMAREDIKYRSISIKNLVGMFLFLCIYLLGIILGTEGFILHIEGIALGSFFLLVSMITKEKLGYGDSFVLLLLGAYLGIWNFVAVVLLALTLSFVYGIIYLFMKKLQRTSEIPFLPFLLVGYIGGYMI